MAVFNGIRIFLKENYFLYFIFLGHKSQRWFLNFKSFFSHEREISFFSSVFSFTFSLFSLFVNLTILLVVHLLPWVVPFFLSVRKWEINPFNTHSLYFTFFLLLFILFVLLFLLHFWSDFTIPWFISFFSRFFFPHLLEDFHKVIQIIPVVLLDGFLKYICVCLCVYKNLWVVICLSDFNPRMRNLIISKVHSFSFMVGLEMANLSFFKLEAWFKEWAI